MDPDEETPETDALADLAKAAADPTKIVTQIQQLRNDAELAGDLEGAERYTQAIGLLLIGGGMADDTEAEDDVMEADAADLAMSADDSDEEPVMDDTIAMRAKVTKAGRKIAGARMALLKSALMSYAKALADAGDEDAGKMLKALAPAAVVDAEATAKSLHKMLEPSLQTLAKTLIDLRERTEKLEAQPAAGGPLKNLSAISKQLGTGTGRIEGKPGSGGADADYLAYLKRQIAIEPNAKTRAHYQEELARLTG